MIKYLLLFFLSFPMVVVAQHAVAPEYCTSLDTAGRDPAMHSAQLLRDNQELCSKLIRREHDSTFFDIRQGVITVLNYIDSLMCTGIELSGGAPCHSQQGFPENTGNKITPGKIMCKDGGARRLLTLVDTMYQNMTELAQRYKIPGFTNPYRNPLQYEATHKWMLQHFCSLSVREFLVALCRMKSEFLEDESGLLHTIEALK